MYIFVSHKTLNFDFDAIKLLDFWFLEKISKRQLKLGMMQLSNSCLHFATKNTHGIIIFLSLINRMNNNGTKRNQSLALGHNILTSIQSEQSAIHVSFFRLCLTNF